MSSEIKDMLNDDREIIAIRFGVDEDGYDVGGKNVTKIAVYGEPGEHCFIPLVAVFIEDEIAIRMSALTARVIYRKLP